MNILSLFNKPKTIKEVQTKNQLSDKISKDLKKILRHAELIRDGELRIERIQKYIP